MSNSHSSLLDLPPFPGLRQRLPSLLYPSHGDEHLVHGQQDGLADWTSKVHSHGGNHEKGPSTQKQTGVAPTVRMSGGCRIGRTSNCDSTNLWEVGTPTRLWWSCQADLEDRIGAEVGEAAWEGVRESAQFRANLEKSSDQTRPAP